MFYKDDTTHGILLIGEIGGQDEQAAAEYVASQAKKGIKKPVAAFIAGVTAPVGRRMGHAGAIISGDKGTGESKEKAFAAAGVPVAKIPSEMIDLIKIALKEKVAV